ncbi:enterobactin/ferric enterobactin esterase [Planctomycetes bacterium Pla163]|uniref:Enterobactin/ferric enterobactin esterase n=1 Tax=Rohdeia mirabilis TaxID=2528008 RepID=A0A518CZ73_9BACT|nr:enterobactin/ferric enterobactin esterase [Planctomycetes bacterium Pla163]
MSTASLERPSHARLGFHGRAELCVVTSDVLHGNPLGDPHVRELPIYLPADHGERPLPLICVLAGFTGRGHKYVEPHPWYASVVQRYDRALAAGEVEPAILVMPDCFTRYGGSQYVDSSATGAYATHVVHELLPLVEEHFNVLPGARGVCGKSSGGFGSLHLAMHFPGVFRAAASISGDCDFELCFGHEFLAAARGLARSGQTPAEFLAGFAQHPNLDGDGHAIINVLAMAACYSPDPTSELGFRLPFDLEYVERDRKVWERWCAFDPLVACEQHTEALRALELLHLECGLADEFNLQWGLRRLVRRLKTLGVPHRHVEHPGGHRGIDDRFEVVLPTLARVLGGHL